MRQHCEGSIFIMERKISFFQGEGGGERQESLLFLLARWSNKRNGRKAERGERAEEVDSSSSFRFRDKQAGWRQHNRIGRQGRKNKRNLTILTGD